jgi:hypothetical protein
MALHIHQTPENLSWVAEEPVKSHAGLYAAFQLLVHSGSCVDEQLRFVHAVLEVRHGQDRKYDSACYIEDTFAKKSAVRTKDK